MTKYKIAIDAGHGSQTAGKRTPDGYKEHWINVRHAYFFEKACIRCGFNTIRIGWDDTNAKDDSDMTILSRQKAIRAASVEVSVSWHANAYGENWNSAEGVETLIHSVSTKQKDSKALAKLVQAELVKGTDQKNRGIKTGNLGLCNATYMRCKAAILIETGFMTNSREVELMKTDVFCKEQAEDACRGICKYLGVDYIAETNSETTSVAAKKPTYKVGEVYTLRVELKVRKGPGTDYEAKKYEELTVDGRKHDADGDGAIDAGTKVTCRAVQEVDGNLWMQTPSGWLAAFYSDRTYIK